MTKAFTAICTVLVLCGSQGATALRPLHHAPTARRASCAAGHAQRVHQPSSVSRTFTTSDVRARRAGTALHALLPEEVIPAAFNVATFGPQIPWLLMVLLPNADVTRKVMGPWTTVLLFSLVHFVIVAASISQPDGTAPLAEFAGVFDPSGNPLQAMVGMMKYPNFVSEEWSHVLTWDLFVGRIIWLDGLSRGIFTAHSVLLTNFIGPPGLLLHYLTCALFYPKKGFLPVPDVVAAPAAAAAAGAGAGAAGTRANKGSVVSAPKIVQELFPRVTTDAGARAVAAACADDVTWEYVNEKETRVGRDAVAAMLTARARALGTAGTTLVIDAVADGQASTGFIWHYQQPGVVGRGLRGTTFVELNGEGKIAYVREVPEPLYKPGAAVGDLLKQVAAQAVAKNPALAVRPPKPAKRSPRGAADLVKYLWNDINGSDVDLSMELFDSDIVYQDFNYPTPFIGKAAVRAFIEEFDFPGIKFIPEKFSEGQKACCFTWRVVIGDSPQAIRGISFYETNKDGTLVTFVRDTAEPALLKPAPLQEVAALVNPGLRRFSPVTDVSVSKY